MSETIMVETEEMEEKEPNPAVTAAHKTLQFGLGALAYTRGELEELFGKLVERGEEAERDGRKMLNEMMERRRKQAETRITGAQEDLEENISRVLQRMNVPTKSDITALNKKVTALTKKVDRLLKETE